MCGHFNHCISLGGGGKCTLFSHFCATDLFHISNRMGGGWGKGVVCEPKQAVHLGISVITHGCIFRRVGEQLAPWVLPRSKAHRSLQWPYRACGRRRALPVEGFIFILVHLFIDVLITWRVLSVKDDSAVSYYSEQSKNFTCVCER